MWKSDPFKRLEPLLIEMIPRTIAEIKITEPICCLRIRYYDTHAPCTYLDLKTVTAAWRSQVLARRGRNAFCDLWWSDSGKGDGPEVTLIDQEPVAKLFKRIYKRLCDNSGGGMHQFRGMLHRVCMRLNSIDWHTICPITNDFVVVPSDGSQSFADDGPDISNSIPAHRLDLLRSRGMLGPGEDYFRRPGFEEALTEEEQVQARPKD